MRMRNAGALLALLVACKAKSEPAERSGPVSGGEGPGGPQLGSGSASVDDHAGPGAPNTATPGGVETNAIQPAKTGEPRRKDTKPTADPAPAVPTPAKPDDAVTPAEVAISEAPSAGGFQGPAGRDPGARLPPGSVGFAGFQSSGLTAQTVADASAKIKTVYRAGLERCYRVHLQTHANATGKATVMLTLAPTGVPTPAVTAFADDLSACLTTIAKGWRFQLPRDARPGGDAPMRLTIELTLTPG
jgi:hypothetical protein